MIVVLIVSQIKNTILLKVYSVVEMKIMEPLNSAIQQVLINSQQRFTAQR